MSKKIILLAVFSAGLLFSCQKENIVPGQNNNVLQESSAQRNQTVSVDVDSDSDKTMYELKLENDVRYEFITDPNNDEDRNKKKKGNH